MLLVSALPPTSLYQHPGEVHIFCSVLQIVQLSQEKVATHDLGKSTLASVEDVEPVDSLESLTHPDALSPREPVSTCRFKSLMPYEVSTNV
jgi:hypothetical protein